MPATTTRTPGDPELTTARRSVSVIFLIYGVLVATWVSRLPEIRRALELDDLQLSLALLGAPVGLLGATLLTGPLIRRFSLPWVARAGLLAAGLALTVNGLAWDRVSLTAALVVYGASMGVVDIAMNSEAVAVERRAGRSLMSGIHGIYSVGVLVGAPIGGLVAATSVAPAVHFACAGAVVATVGWIASRTLLPPAAPAPTDPDAPARRPSLLRHPYVLAVGVMGLFAFFAEGAVDDWAGIYIHEVQGGSLGIAPLGAAVCGGGMAIGRFFGDRVISRFGHLAVLWRAALLASAGLVIAVVLAPSPGVAIAGYGVFGLGVSVIIPIAISLAGAAPGVSSVWAVSRVATLGYGGLFAGPPVIGALSHVTSLGTALAAPAVLLLLVPVLGWAVGRQPTKLPERRVV